MDPELIKSVLVKDFNHFTNRRSLGLGKGDKFMHNMLFFMEDQPWKEMRATVSPTFSTGKIKNMNGLLNESGAKVVEYLSTKIDAISKNTDADDVDDGIEIDVFGRYTLDVIASVAFGVDSENFTKSNSPFYEMSQQFSDSAKISPAVLVKFITLTMASKIFEWMQWSLFDKIATSFFANVSEKSIVQREADSGSSGKQNDFLQLMIDAKHGILKNDEGEKDVDSEGQTGSGRATLTNDTILANCVLFFIAGFDTSESVLMFTAYELALNLEIQEKLYEEIDDTMDTHNGQLSYEAVASMRYLDMVISESLRKYPPVVRLERQANLEYKISNSDLILEKGSRVIIPTFGIHRDPDFYPNPDKFIPERFTAESKSQRHPYTYLPFGTGPRSCVAMRFALTEAKSAIAHLVHKFRFEPCTNTPNPLTFKKAASALKPSNGICLKIKPRK